MKLSKIRHLQGEGNQRFALNLLWVYKFYVFALNYSLRIIYVTRVLVVVNHNLLNFFHYNLCHFVRARQNYFLCCFKSMFYEIMENFLFFSYLSLFLTTWVKLFTVTVPFKVIRVKRPIICLILYVPCILISILQGA